MGQPYHGSASTTQSHERCAPQEPGIAVLRHGLQGGCVRFSNKKKKKEEKAKKAEQKKSKGIEDCEEEQLSWLVY